MKRTATLFCILALCLAMSATAATSAFAKEDEMKSLNMMKWYVDFLKEWTTIVSDGRQAISFAQNSLKDLYEGNGEVEKAIPVLLKALEDVKDQGARNAIRFTVADIYKNQGEMEKSAEQYLKIIEENAKSAGK